MKTTLESNLADTKILRAEVIPGFDEGDITTLEAESAEPHLTSSQKRFRVLFYALSALTAILVVQVIWQIAVLATKCL